ncbi:MAG: glycosyltransferase family 2 protein [Pseudomonadota bacterium]|jgi:glycosyltransferase involved in cell wall biosynthesis
MNAARPVVVAVIPARDEAAVIGTVVKGLLALDDGAGPRIAGVVVCDNGSRDGTAEVAREAGARVVREDMPGYGAACLAALAAIGPCDIVLFVDGDGSVDPTDVPALLAEMARGADLVIGWRPRAWQQPHAMGWPQRMGNLIAVALIVVLFGRRFRDLGPLRAIRTRSLAALSMADRAYGWTVEMQVKALLAGCRIAEVPVHLRRRVGRSKISGTWRGVLGAGTGIIGTVLALRLASWAQRWRWTRRAGNDA